MNRGRWRIGLLAGLLAVMPAAVQTAAEAAGTPQPAQAGRDAMEISVHGIDDAIRALNAVQGNPQAQQAALVLLLVQGVGKKRPPEGGRSRYDYQVDVQPDGHILINGLDVSVLIQAAQKRPH